MSGAADIQLVLDAPPSANRMWRTFRGRAVASPEYRAWKAAQAERIAQQLGGDGVPEWFGAAIVLPPSRRDPDNSVKPLLDVLQLGGAIRNDRLLRHLTLRVDDDREAGSVAVALWAVVGPKPKPRTRKRA